MKNYEVRNIQLKRFYFSNRLYFITTVTEDRVPIFSHEQNIRILFGAISEYSHRYAVKIHAFVVLPDHAHLLITPTTDTFTISHFMKGVKGKSAREINRQRTVKTSDTGTAEAVPTNPNVGTDSSVPGLTARLHPCLCPRAYGNTNFLTMWFGIRRIIGHM
ncbi:MAG: transposase [Planctomycetes bacterium]|nr:transposase [Planctomycetota bacterium]